LDKRRQQQQEFLRQKTLIAGEKADSRADSVGNSNTDKLVNKQKAAMEALSGGRNTPIISAGMYISSHLCPFAVLAQKIWGIKFLKPGSKLFNTQNKTASELLDSSNALKCA